MNQDDTTDNSLRENGTPIAASAERTIRFIRRAAIGVAGVTVILIGVALIVLPGPAFVVIPAGLAILATEFVWAKRLLRRAKKKFEELRNRNGRTQTKSPPERQSA